MSKISISLDTITLRVNVEDASKYDYKFLESNKPDYVLWVSRSSNSTCQKTKMLISCCGEYKVSEIKKWLKTGYSKVSINYND